LARTAPCERRALVRTLDDRGTTAARLPRRAGDDVFICSRPGAEGIFASETRPRWQPLPKGLLHSATSHGFWIHDAVRLRVSDFGKPAICAPSDVRSQRGKMSRTTTVLILFLAAVLE